MKKPSYIVLIPLLILASCKNPGKEKQETVINQKDISTITKHSSAGTHDNEVKSEAPDALTKTEQGYALPRFDDGLAQSPINILSSKTEKENHPRVVLKFNDEINAVENLGHTIQLDFTEGSTINVDGKIYKFKQLHFHTPSEHLIDGITYPMELHVVTVLKDQKDSTRPEYLVVGMLFKMGKENKFIREFLNSIPPEENEKTALRKGAVKLNDLLAGIPENELSPYYHYTGSLTTPPYTESVNWIVKKYIFEASSEQLAYMEKMEGDNARHIQALHKRKITTH